MFKLKEISNEMQAMQARIHALEEKVSDSLEVAEAKDAEIAELVNELKAKDAELEEEKAKIEAKEELIEAKEEDLEVEAEVKAVEKLAEIGHQAPVEDSAEAPKTLDEHIKIYQSMKRGTAEAVAYRRKHID